jgi:hypothetical protein
VLHWGRARVGSPMEDLMSGLHSLGLWELSARRIHDAMLTEHRRACGSPDGLPDSYNRSLSWLAGACNAMAGALRYHLAVSADPERAPEDRWKSARAAADWLRISCRVMRSGAPDGRLRKVLSTVKSDQLTGKSRSSRPAVLPLAPWSECGRLRTELLRRPLATHSELG